MVTRCLPSCCAAGGTMASAAPFRTSSSAGGARRASGTRCCPSSLCVLAVPASAPRCCVPLAAVNGAPPTNAPLRAFLPGARVAQVSATPPSICRRAPASASANACRRRSSLPALVAYHTGGGRPRPILRGADPCPACATAPPSLCQAAFAPMRLERPCLVSLAPGERDPPSVIAANVSSPPPGKFPETTPTPSLVTAPLFHALSGHSCTLSPLRQAATPGPALQLLSVRLSRVFLLTLLPSCPFPSPCRQLVTLLPFPWASVTRLTSRWGWRPLLPSLPLLPYAMQRAACFFPPSPRQPRRSGDRDSPLGPSPHRCRLRGERDPPFRRPSQCRCVSSNGCSPPRLPPCAWGRATERTIFFSTPLRLPSASPYRSALGGGSLDKRELLLDARHPECMSS
ncbi:unnamed protein product [Closterium sp. NIES-65]|nr:unnamed protein product [Closterium sp. NIES-65]